ncbi:MAG: PorT family protein [Tannerella sp.]|jgi:hypothetical protein|nr:PorT family protein [Tannerella sp.]
MKKILFIIGLAMLLSTGADAQFTVGPKVGLNLTSLQDKGAMPEDPSRRQGLTAGTFLNCRLMPSFELQGELLYSQQGYKEHVFLLVDYGGGVRTSHEAKRRLHYLSIPVLFREYWRKTGLYVELGPQVGLLLQQRVTFADRGDIDDYLNALPFPSNPVDFSVVGGAGYRFRFGITLSGRYCYGFTNVLKDMTSRNHVIQLALTYDLLSF